MKALIILLLLLITTVADQENVNNNNTINNNHCRWKYKCCKLFKGTCIKMCDPEIDCGQEDVIVIETTPKILFGFAPVQALNVRCKFGYKVDARQNCRRVLK